MQQIRAVPFSLKSRWLQPLSRAMSRRFPLRPKSSHSIQAGEISLYEATFWLKSLAGAFFAYADGLTYSIRETAASSADLLSDRLSRNLLRDLNTSKRLPLERAVAVALKSLCHLCLATPVIDTSSEDFRGFKALMEARERFVHPKSHLDVCPFELFPTINPALERCEALAGVWAG